MIMENIADHLQHEEMTSKQRKAERRDLRIEMINLEGTAYL